MVKASRGARGANISLKGIFTKVTSEIARFLRGPPDNEWFVTNDVDGESYKQEALYPTAFIRAPKKGWDGYQHENTVIVTGLYTNTRTWNMRDDILRLGSGDGFNQVVDGEVMKVRPEKTIVISQQHPKDVFDAIDFDAIRKKYDIKCVENDTTSHLSQ